MLERMTEKARRVLFFARYEASQYGSPVIESEHLLLGLIREDKALANRYLQARGSTESVRKKIEARITIHERVSASIDVPLSLQSNRILMFAAEEADNLPTEHVGTEHLLLGILREESSFAAEIVSAEGLQLTRLREELRKNLPKVQAMDSFEGEESATTSWSGIGYDLHRLEAGRKLVIGGIEVPFDKGPVGHSDGDVLAHAICDAVLGAAGLGDIGTHFPDTDPRWKGASSLIFLKHLQQLLAERKSSIIHIDAVVILERPKLGPHFPAMREALSQALGISKEQVHLKAKTNEGVDAVGRGEAIACYAVATLTA